MKRYTHAWVALRAIDRLGKLAETVYRQAVDASETKKAKAEGEADPKKKNKLLQESKELIIEAQNNYDSIVSLQAMLRDREFIGLVVQGTWIPDNVLKDNSDGHIWKYEPPLRKGKPVFSGGGDKAFNRYVVEVGGKRILYRADHAKTSSLCYDEARNAYAWGKPWRKIGGFLADRCEAVHQAVRDAFLFQRDEMHKIAATLLAKYGSDLFSKREEVTAFLSDPDEVKAYYDLKPNEKYVNRARVVEIRGKIGYNGEINRLVQKCLEAYQVSIKNYITKTNGLRYTENKSSFFPMFFTNEQIILQLFALSHYLADAHMPLHCDSRNFSLGECSNIHGKIEEEWEDWVIESTAKEQLDDILSESERADKFIAKCFAGASPEWRNFNYPLGSILEKFDDELGPAIWDGRDIEFYEGTNLWEELVGITYASYCLSSRLVEFNEKKRVVPSGRKSSYDKDFEGEVFEVKGDGWKSHVDGNGIKECLKEGSIRKEIYDFAAKHAPDNAAFVYLSLLLLVDAVNCVAKIWGKIVKDHLDIAYQET